MANKLIHEKSPYLLQHAENPVNWYPWSKEAFQKAESEEKPVFLSIGYSTCHWCHVMAHESFEDPEIARVLNTFFVPVKVDREERPEVDTVYMSVCQAMTGQGGWPLTILMTPDKKPFFVATYLPARSRYGMTGLLELLTETVRLWSGSRERLFNTAQQVLSHLNSQNTETGAGKPSWDLVEKGFAELKASFDPDYGGFGRAPKFPVPHNLLFLLMFYAGNGRKQALSMAEKTLVSMARGGIHDQIGGGFSRYSTDDRWLVPHFEKMLYDNALLTLAYLEGFRLTGRTCYRDIAEKILAYTGRELSDPDGGFYCGQDADSEGVEGKYYVFSAGETGMIFNDPKQREDFCRLFDITEKGNFEGLNIPNLIHSQNYEYRDSYTDDLCRKAYEYRRRRTMLHTDDKILTSWNSLMILAYAKAGSLLSNPGYLERAKKAQQFIESRLIDKNGRLLVRYRDGESAFSGNLDDYAFYCMALLSLYEATLEIGYLEDTVLWAGKMTDLFLDEENGGFYFYGKDAEKLIGRPKEIYDGAIPSGNSAAAHVLLSLARLTADQTWRDRSDRQLCFLASGIKDFPSAHCFSLLAFLKELGPEKELICVSRDNQAPKELLEYKNQQGNGLLSILFKCPENADRLAKAAPFTAGYKIPEQGLCYYLCENKRCSVPLFSLPGKEK